MKGFILLKDSNGIEHYLKISNIDYFRDNYIYMVSKTSFKTEYTCEEIKILINKSESQESESFTEMKHKEFILEKKLLLMESLINFNY